MVMKMSSIHHFSSHQKLQYTYFRIYVFFYYFWLALYIPFQPLYFIHIGIPIYGVFLNAGLATLLSFFIGNKWSKHAKYGNRKKFLLLGNFAMVCACIMTYFTNSFHMMLIITIVQGLAPNADVMATVLVYDLSEAAENLHLVSDTEKKYHQINIYARYRNFGSLGWAFSLPLMGILLNFVPKRVESGIMFIIAAVGFFLISIFFIIKVKEPNTSNDANEEIEDELKTVPDPTIEKTTLKEDSIIKAIQRLITNRMYLVFMIFAFFFNISSSISFQIQGIFFENFTSNYLLWGLTYSIAALAEWPVMHIVAKYVEKWSWERMIVVAYLLTAFRMFMMLILAGFYQNLIIAYLLQIMMGITYGIRLPTTTFGIHTILNKDNRTLGQSFNETIRMMGALIASLTGAVFAYFLSEELVYIAIYGVSAILGLIAGLGFLYYVQKINKTS